MELSAQPASPERHADNTRFGGRGVGAIRAPLGSFRLYASAGLVSVSALAVSIDSATSTAPVEPAKVAQDQFPRLITPVDYPSPSLSNLAPHLAVIANIEREPDGKVELVSRFDFSGSESGRSNAIECLAAAGLYEAGIGRHDQTAVMQVVINRARHPAYPSSICNVVFQGSERRTGCQFTFTCDGSLARTYSGSAWRSARITAASMLDGESDDRVGTATHYHADYVLPRWSHKLEKLTQIGSHIFYRFPGKSGGSSNLLATVDGDRSKPSALDPGRTMPDDAGSPRIVAVPPGSASEFEGPATVSRTMEDRPAKAATNAAFVTVADTQIPAGRWAVQALNRCSGRESCTVLMYETSAQAQRNSSATAAHRERPLFAFIRDRASGMQKALWRCEQVPRDQASQCLPDDGPTLTRLLRDRST